MDHEPNESFWRGRGGRGLLLLAVVAIAAAVRFQGLDFGLPHTRCRPDENKILGILTSPWRSFHPDSFAYPSLYKYLVLAANGGYYAVGRALWRFDGAADFMAEYVVAPRTMYLVARSLAAGLGVATVFLVYRAARLVTTPRAALVAAFFLGLAHLHVRDSHFAVTDVPMTFFLVGALYFVLKAHADGRLRDYLLAGLLCGLATSTKYSAVFLVLSMGIAHVLRAREERLPVARWVADERLVAFAVAAAALFVVGTPYAVLDYPRFSEDFARQGHHLARGHGLVLGRGWGYHLGFSLPAGMGWPLFLASLAGLPLLVRRGPAHASVFLAFPVAYYAVSGSGYAVFVRYMIPMLPFLCIAAAVFVDELAERAGRARPRLAGAATLLLALLLIAPSARAVLRTNRLLAQRDNRLVATDWVVRNLPAGSSIFQLGSRSARLQLPESLASLERSPLLVMLPWDRGWLAESLPELAAAAGPDFEEWEYDADSDRFTCRGAPRSPLPDYMIVMRSALPRYEKPAPEIERRLEESYRLLRSFEAIDLENAVNRFDPVDAFYVPFAGIEGVARPGPNVHVYERADRPPRGER